MTFPQVSFAVALTVNFVPATCGVTIEASVKLPSVEPGETVTDGCDPTRLKSLPGVPLKSFDCFAWVATG